MNRAILLAGLHKTGTTSIQKTFRQHAVEIERAGFTYPLLTLKVGNPDASPENHSKLLQGMFARRVGQTKSTENTFREVLQRDVDRFLRARGTTNLILAAEVLSTMPADDLRDLKDWLEKRDFRIDVFCSVRPVRPWLASMVAQRIIGMHGPRLTLPQAIHEFEIAGGIVKPRMERLAAVFPGTKFFSFDRAIRHRQGPFGNFAELVGLAGLDHIEPVHANEGKSDPAVRLNSLVNESLGRRSDHREDYIRLLKQYPALQLIPGPKFRLIAHDAMKLAPVIGSENEWLKNIYGVEFADGQDSAADGPSPLGLDTLQFLESQFVDAAPWLRSIIESFCEGP